MTARLLHAFELHDPALIREALPGVDPEAPINGKAPIMRLVEMYTRSPRFSDCLRTMVEGGARLGDPLLECLLLDDDEALKASLDTAADGLDRRFSLDCAYTSLEGVGPLHICAEYNSVRCAQVLLKAGADIDLQADVQAGGTGGQTPIFHTVNSNGDHCRPMMALLADAGASLDVRVPALVWGGGFEWETVIFDASPISYAQCGLYPQFHRDPAAIYGAIDDLYRRKQGSPAPVRNVPNRYLR